MWVAGGLEGQRHWLRAAVVAVQACRLYYGRHTSCYRHQGNLLLTFASPPLFHPAPLQPAASCEVVAFSLGGLTSMPALRNFSVCAALAVLLDFLLQVTAFVALLALDTRRLEQGRFDCWPWRRWVGWEWGLQHAGTRAEACDEASDGAWLLCT